MQEYGIQGFPTIKVFGVGKSPLDYQGAREAKPIVDYALGQVLIILHYSHIQVLWIFSHMVKSTHGLPFVMEKTGEKPCP